MANPSPAVEDRIDRLHQSFVTGQIELRDFTKRLATLIPGRNKHLAALREALADRTRYERNRPPKEEPT